jgi:hypothetical protein
MIGSHTAFVITEDHVHNPMQAVFNRPMAAHDRAHESCRAHRGGDIKPCLLFGFSADLTAALDDDDGFQSWPAMSLLQPLDVMDDSGCSGLDAAMIAPGLRRGRLSIVVSWLIASDLTDSEADAISSVFTRNFPAGRLLLMRRATDRAKAGSVEPFGLKAMIGYLSNFAHDLKGTPLIMYDEWHSVCVQALALSRSATPEPAAVASCSMPASRSTNALPA